MIWRVRGTRAFAELRRGHRASSGPLTVVVVLDPDGAPVVPPRLAFAVGRKTGGAVTRNRLRRQLRDAARGLPQPEVLGPGNHLVIVRPEAAGCSYDELASHLRRALVRARDRAGAPPAVVASP